MTRRKTSNAIVGNLPLDTLDNARCIIDLLVETVPSSIPEGISDDAALGLNLVLTLVADAIKDAEESLRRDYERKSVTTAVEVDHG